MPKNADWWQFTLSTDNSNNNQNHNNKVSSVLSFFTIGFRASYPMTLFDEPGDDYGLKITLLSDGIVDDCFFTFIVVVSNSAQKNKELSSFTNSQKVCVQFEDRQEKAFYSLCLHNTLNSH